MTRRRVALWVKRWRTEISMFTVALYLAVLLPASILLFPDSNAWLAALILLVGFLDEVKDLADQVEDEQ